MEHWETRLTKVEKSFDLFRFSFWSMLSMSKERVDRILGWHVYLWRSSDKSRNNMGFGRFHPSFRSSSSFFPPRSEGEASRGAIVQQSRSTNSLASSLASTNQICLFDYYWKALLLLLLLLSDDLFFLLLLLARETAIRFHLFILITMTRWLDEESSQGRVDDRHPPPYIKSIKRRL